MKHITKLSLIAGAALAVTSVQSAQAQQSYRSCTPSYSYRYHAPQSSYGQTRYYDYGYRQPVAVHRTYRTYYGNSTYYSRPYVTPRYSRSRSYRTFANPNIYYNYTRPAYVTPWYGFYR